MVGNSQFVSLYLHFLLFLLASCRKRTRRISKKERLFLPIFHWYSMDSERLMLIFPQYMKWKILEDSKLKRLLISPSLGLFTQFICLHFICFSIFTFYFFFSIPSYLTTSSRQRCVFEIILYRVTWQIWQAYEMNRPLFTQPIQW